MNRIAPILIALLLALGPVTDALSDYTYSYESIDYPEAEETWANGVNDSAQVVGYHYTGDDYTLWADNFGATAEPSAGVGSGQRLTQP